MFIIVCGTYPPSQVEPGAEMFETVVSFVLDQATYLELLVFDDPHRVRVPDVLFVTLLATTLNDL
jgi:hypothetical protein